MVALAKAQGAIEDIERDRTVTVQPRAGNAYSFKYATLPAIIRGIKKALSDNGIAYTQVLTFDKTDRLYYLTTNLHYENQFISSVTPLIIGGDAGNQQFGSALTYMKRYALAALVGVAADEDDDGNAADGNEIKAMQETAKKAPKPPMPDPISTMHIPAKTTDLTVEDLPFNAVKIEVPHHNGDHNWMEWGQTFMKYARAAPTGAALEELEAENKVPLKNMETYAPKMFANMGVALIKVRKSLEKKDAG